MRANLTNAAWAAAAVLITAASATLGLWLAHDAAMIPLAFIFGMLALFWFAQLQFMPPRRR